MPEEKCPSCGAPYEADATFCVNCGARRQEPSEVEPAGPTEPPAPERPLEEEPPPAKEAVPLEASTPPRPASEEKVLERLDDELASAGPPEPTKKSRKGCCIAAVAVGGGFLLLVACGLSLYYTGVLDRDKYTSDFAAVTAQDFTVWQKGKNALVTQENEMLKVRDALVGVNYDPGGDYTASCTVFVQAIENDLGWAGLVARVNPKGGERYVFEILPKKKLARIEKKGGKTKPLVLAGSYVPALRLGVPYTLAAAVSGNELSMELNGTVVCRATDIGLLEGPMGFEARGATAYFDDLTVRPE